MKPYSITTQISLLNGGSIMQNSHSTSGELYNIDDACGETKIVITKLLLK